MEELEQFRDQARAWLESNCPASQRKPPLQSEQYWGGRNAVFPSEDARLWFERMRDQRWIVPHWPREYGGAGLQRGAHAHHRERDEAAGLPQTAAQPRHLDARAGAARIRQRGAEAPGPHCNCRGRIRWCQGYSESGAGSDLANLQTRAEDCGDHFLVNGSKIWTSFADHADWIFCLVRTDPQASKQQGISFLLIDMATPGISVSPIELISGKSEFCQTFFDNVRVPRENLVGELHGGWSVAKTLLKHERKLMAEMGSESPNATLAPVDCAKRYLALRDGRIEDALLRDALARHEMQMHAIGLTQQRIIQEARTGSGSGHASLVMKYCGTEQEKRKYELMIAMMGSQGIGWEGEDFSATEIDTARQCLFSKALSIAGGTTEVQLNIIAKRILGLPGVT